MRSIRLIDINIIMKVILLKFYIPNIQLQMPRQGM